MRRKLSVFSIPVVVVALLAGCASEPVDVPTEPSPSVGADNAVGVVYFSADYPSYPTLDAAVAAADNIVQADYVSSWGELVYPDVSDSGSAIENPQAGIHVSEDERELMAVPVTVSSLRVVTSLKGDIAAGTVIHVSQLGGMSRGVTYVEKRTILFRDAASSTGLLLFINAHDGLGMDLISPDQGLRFVVGDMAMPARSVDGRSEEVPAYSMAQIEAAIKAG
jgi:hypothetical protein